MTKNKNNKRKLSNNSLIILITVIVIAILIISYLLVNNLVFSSKIIATKYVEAVGEERVAKQLSYTDVYDYENDFVKKSVIEKKEKDAKYKEIKKISILNQDEIKKLKNIDVPEKTKNTRVYVFKYTRKNIKNAKYIVVELKKGNNKFLIFQNWRVINGNYLAKNVKIKASKNSKIYIDSVKLTNKYFDSKTNMYVIPYLLKKNVDINIKLNDGSFLNKTFNPYDNIVIDVADTHDYKLSTSSFKNLKNISNEFINSYIVNALEGKDINKVKKSNIWSTSILKNDSFATVYTDLVKSYSSKKITNFKVSSIDLSSSYLNNEKNIKLLAMVKYIYMKDKKEKSNTTYLDLTIISENNSLKINDFSESGLKYMF